MVLTLNRDQSDPGRRPESLGGGPAQIPPPSGLDLGGGLLGRRLNPRASVQDQHPRKSGGQQRDRGEPRGGRRNILADLCAEPRRANPRGVRAGDRRRVAGGRPGAGSKPDSRAHRARSSAVLRVLLASALRPRAVRWLRALPTQPMPGVRPHRGRSRERAVLGPGCRRLDDRAGWSPWGPVRSLSVHAWRASLGLPGEPGTSLGPGCRPASPGA